MPTPSFQFWQFLMLGPVFGGDLGRPQHVDEPGHFLVKSRRAGLGQLVATALAAERRQISTYVYKNQKLIPSYAFANKPP